VHSHETILIKVISKFLFSCNSIAPRRPSRGLVSKEYWRFAGDREDPGFEPGTAGPKPNTLLCAISFYVKCIMQPYLGACTISSQYFRIVCEWYYIPGPYLCTLYNVQCTTYISAKINLLFELCKQYYLWCVLVCMYTARYTMHICTNCTYGRRPREGHADNFISFLLVSKDSKHIARSRLGFSHVFTPV
jgi:hypothetical protein